MNEFQGMRYLKVTT